MCLGMPMKIMRIEGEHAVAEAQGISREIGLHLLENVNVGDVVMVHAGFAIEKLDPGEAEETWRLMQQYGVRDQ